MARETNARMMHRFNCKHSHYENCMKKSGWYGSFHILMGCDGECRRMKIYDNKIKRDNEAKNRSKDNQVNLPE